MTRHPAREWTNEDYEDRSAATGTFETKEPSQEELARREAMATGTW